MAESLPLQVRYLGQRDYREIWQAMMDFTRDRTDDTSDELWLLEHAPVFTQGQAGKAEHLLFPGDIPVVQSDRGGQVTYHGPGQLIAYPLLSLRRLNIGVRDLVTMIEQTIVALLEHYAIAASPKPDAPGVYVDGAKIASLGLRVRRSCSFHGLSLNVSLDLSPFSRINPCGYQGLQMTRMADLLQDVPTMAQVAEQLVDQFVRKSGHKPCTMPAVLPGFRGDAVNSLTE